MKIVSREEVTEKIDENTNKIVESIISEFNERKDPDIFFVRKVLYDGLSESYIILVIDKLNDLLKDYNYFVYYNYLDGFWIKYK